MNSEQIHGLTRAEVAKKQATAGYNELPDRETRSLAKQIIQILTEPMIFLLVAVVVVYFLLGDRNEAMVLLFSVLVVIGIELYQDSKTEKALEALRSLASPSCEVVRDGEHMTIPSRELVVGDILVVSEGKRVAADARLLNSHNIMADESILTGESVPVDKTAEMTEDFRVNTVYSGSIIVKGHGLAEVTAIGVDTEMGKIGVSLGTIKPEKTLLQKEVARTVKYIAVIAISLSVLLTLLFWLLRGDLLNGFLAGLTLSIAVLPEEFPVVLTVFMALGAWRLAKSNVLSRRSQTIETLGSATVLCTDKTGTLTENRMSVAGVVDVDGKALDGGEQYSEIVAYGVLASQKNPFDPMEEAFIAAAKEHRDLSTIYGDMEITKEYPLEEASRSAAHIWSSPDSVARVLALKGAPEDVFELCKLPKATHEILRAAVESYAKEGLRVLAVAKGTVTQTIERQREAYEYELLGLVALADPIRKEAAGAVKLAHQAGIRVVMITGDYAETARRIGHEIGLASERVVTGEEFMKASDAERDDIVKNAEIYSRVAPAVKLEIVNALKRNGEVVAMTGDGVNDGPALKTAHIGIAMGQRGTDVAREAASIVLLDDNFASIVSGVRTGRRIFANLQKTTAYILTVHIPIAILSMVPVLFGWPLILLPIHIVFLEFIIDPSCTLVFEGEPEDVNAMKQPPRRLNAPLFSRQLILRSLAEGAMLAAIMVATHGYLLSHGWSEEHARGVTFLFVVLTNILLIVAISGRRVVKEAFSRQPTALTYIVSGAIVILTAIYALAPMRTLFKIEALDIMELTIAILGAVIATSLVVPFRKLIR